MANQTFSAQMASDAVLSTFKGEIKPNDSKWLTKLTELMTGRSASSLKRMANLLNTAHHMQHQVENKPVEQLSDRLAETVSATKAPEKGDAVWAPEADDDGVVRCEYRAHFVRMDKKTGLPVVEWVDWSDLGQCVVDYVIVTTEKAIKGRKWRDAVGPVEAAAAEEGEAEAEPTTAKKPTVADRVAAKKAKAEPEAAPAKKLTVADKVAAKKTAAAEPALPKGNNAKELAAIAANFMEKTGRAAPKAVTPAKASEIADDDMLGDDDLLLEIETAPAKPKANRPAPKAPEAKAPAKTPAKAVAKAVNKAVTAKAAPAKTAKAKPAAAKAAPAKKAGAKRVAA